MKKTPQKDFYIPSVVCESLAKLFKIDKEEIVNNKDLFYRIDPHVAKCLEHLSQIEDDDLKISAALSLNYLVKYKEPSF